MVGVTFVLVVAGNYWFSPEAVSLLVLLLLSTLLVLVVLHCSSDPPDRSHEIPRCDASECRVVDPPDHPNSKNDFVLCGHVGLGFVEAILCELACPRLLGAR